jgi:hypothetical protein
MVPITAASAQVTQSPAVDASSASAAGGTSQISSPSTSLVQSTPAIYQQEPMPNRTDQIKTILAAIGIIAVLFHGIRLIGAGVG